MGNHHQAIGIAGANDIARIHLSQSQSSADWRGNAGVAQLQSGIIDLCLIHFYRAFKLFNQRILCIELLLGDRILREQGPVALKIDSGIGKLRLIARELTLDLRQCDPQWLRINFGKHLARFDYRAFLKIDALQQAIDTCLNGGDFERGNRAKAGLNNIDGAQFGGHRSHRLHAVGIIAKPPATRPARTTCTCTACSGGGTACALGICSRVSTGRPEPLIPDATANGGNQQ